MTARPVPLALAALLGAALPARAGVPWEPPGWRVPPATAAEESTSAPAVALSWAVGAYRATISRVDGDRCPSHPTCSAYALEAVGRHGALLGAVLTAGRLLTEADEPAFAPRIFVGGRWQTYAPVEDDLAFLRGPLAP